MPHPRLSDATAAAIELLHCASLVHDDLPCFDDAATRRGLPSVHAAYGERLAVLTGDALIVLSFQALADGRRGARYGRGCSRPLLADVARRVGGPTGIVAGQAWECEPRVTLAAYHQAKTGSLFAACTEAGALAAGADPAPWRAFGLSLGEAYQVADDVRDVVATTQALGKPAGRDRALRPAEFGLGAGPGRRHRILRSAGGARHRRHPRLRRRRACCARWCAPSRSAWCRRTACATWRWRPRAGMDAVEPGPPRPWR